MRTDDAAAMLSALNPNIIVMVSAHQKTSVSGK